MQYVRMPITLFFITRKPCWCKGLYLKVQGDQKFSVHLKIRKAKVPRDSQGGPRGSG